MVQIYAKVAEKIIKICQNNNAKNQKYESCEMFQIPASVNIPSNFDQVSWIPFIRAFLKNFSYQPV